jgi:hypothetical protein
MKVKTLIVKFRTQLDGVLPELEHVLVRLGLFAVFTIKLITIVTRAILSHL